MKQNNIQTNYELRDKKAQWKLFQLNKFYLVFLKLSLLDLNHS